MDKVKELLKRVNQHIFWVLFLVVLGVSLFAWNSATGKLDSQFAEEETKIDGIQQQLKSVTSQSPHPNEKVLVDLKSKTEVLAFKVGQQWDALYDQQRNTVLNWPKDILGVDFVNRITGKRFGDEIDQNMRELYQNKIKIRFGELRYIVRAKYEALTGLGEDSKTNPDLNADPPLLIWENQNNLLNAMLWRRTPSSMTIWINQENLWIYESLLQAIAKTNEQAGASAIHNAAISQINGIYVGKNATKISGVVKMIGKNVITAPATSATAAGQSNLSGEDQMLVDGRYVDMENKPIKGVNPNASQYKRVPVKLLLTMNHRKIQDLLVNLATQPLPLTVKQVRLNYSEDDGSGRKKSTSGHAQKPLQRPVSIQGYIVIFNPADYQSLGLNADGSIPGGAADSPATAVSTSGTTPGGTGSAAPPPGSPGSPGSGTPPPAAASDVGSGPPPPPGSPGAPVVPAAP